MSAAVATACCCKRIEQRSEFGPNTSRTPCRNLAGVPGVCIHQHRTGVFPVPCKDICDIACQRCVMHFVDTGLTFNSGQSFYCIDHVHAVQPGNLPCLVEIMGRPHAECCPDIPVTAFPAGIDHRGECVSVLNHLALEMVGITVHHLKTCPCRVRGSFQYHPREQDVRPGYIFAFYRVTSLVDEI